LNNYRNIPDELKEFNQWLLCSQEEKRPLSIDKNGNLFNASIKKSEQFLSFSDALIFSNKHNCQIGFVLTVEDPFTCIDLDVKDSSNCADSNQWTTSEDISNYYKLIEKFSTYTEKSRSGKGFHLWMKGDIGDGQRTGGIEIYSRDRFIICTGNTIDKDLCALEDRQALLNELFSIKSSITDFELKEGEEEEGADWYILTKISESANFDKFCELWEGNWKESYSSQSEADSALMAFFCYWSNSDAQCRRLFRESALGKRGKACVDNIYLNRTIKFIRQKRLEEEALETSAKRASEDFLKRNVEEVLKIQGNIYREDRISSPLNVVKDPGELSIAPKEVSILNSIESDSNGGGSISWPPGFIGKVAKFIYSSSPRPVKEISIVAALGLFSGICGKAWHIPQSGLNNYIILLAKSGVGKEAMHSGIALLIKACCEKMPEFQRFVSFNEFASAQALVKTCASNNSFVNVMGEFGRKIRRMSTDHRDQNLQAIRTMITNLYQKSGPQSIIGGLQYSDKEKNIESVSGVAYSLIGESTPGTFYESLNSSMIEDGFLSRFIIISYNGERVPANRNQVLLPDDLLRDALIKLASQALVLNGTGKAQSIGRNEIVAGIFNDFEIECDDNINSSDDESFRQMWNRASLKAMRIAGLLAVADNWITPVIEKHHAEWAINLIRNDIKIMSGKFKSGDIGSGDDVREKKIISLIKEYLYNENVSTVYRVPIALIKNGIISRSFIQKRVSSLSSFYSHQKGSTSAMDEAIESVIKNGYLGEISKKELAENYAFHGKAWRILNFD
jgi:hypothetical protein